MDNLQDHDEYKNGRAEVDVYQTLLKGVVNQHLQWLTNEGWMGIEDRIQVLY